ncbi:MAG: hypothetical protein ABI462_11025 [Ignavibacteria bacterium]
MNPKGLFHFILFFLMIINTSGYSFTRNNPDGIQFNDHFTKTNLAVIETNYGNDSGYFYANTLATDRPSFPRYVWKDTSGSKTLVLNGVAAPGTILVGTLDDGYFRLSLKKILLSFGLDTTDKHIRYSGNCYDSIFPATNGLIGFTQSFGATSLSEFRVDGALVPKNALLPIWHDFNLGSIVSSLSNRVSYTVKGNQLIITYDKVQSFSPVTDWASFQVVIEIVTGCEGANSNFRYTFADSTTGQTSSSFVSNYILAYNSAPGSATIFRNYLTGFSITGAPVPYGSYVATANPFPAIPSTQSFIKRPVYDPITLSGLAVEFGPNVNNLNVHNSILLKLSVSLQGLQSNFRVRDTVEVILRDGSGAPYQIFQKKKIYLDSAFNGSFSYGTKTFEITSLKKNYPYYLVISHRSSVVSWSNITSTSGDTLKYDFTSSLSQTFGSNAKLVNGAASIYSGDIDVTHDGCVNLTDVIGINNDATLFISGDYFLTDLNWDGAPNLLDVIIAANNNLAFVCVAEPPGATNISNNDMIRQNANGGEVNKALSFPDSLLIPKDKNVKRGSVPYK